MEEYVKKHNRLISAKLIQAFASRNIEAFFSETKDEALAKALELIPETSTVTWGGSFSIEAIGLKTALINGNYTVLNRDIAPDAQAKRDIELASYNADFFLCSANAITQDGIIVNLDGAGNRVSAIANGPKTVLFIIGMNKLTKDIDSALSRVRNLAAPSNTLRFQLNTPCTSTGYCADCKSPDCICCHFLITRFCRQNGRIKVLLVNEELGF